MKIKIEIEMDTEIHEDKQLVQQIVELLENLRNED